jgi:hypothetical protein
MQFWADVFAKAMYFSGSHRGMIKELGYDDPALTDKLHLFCMLRNKLLIPVSCFHELYESDYGRKFGIGGIVKGMVCFRSSWSHAYVDCLLGGRRGIGLHSRPPENTHADRSRENEQVLRAGRSILRKRLSRASQDVC